MKKVKSLLKGLLKSSPVTKFTQSWTACMTMMVEGNLAALTFVHAQTAAKTGILAAAGATVAQFLPLKFAYKEVYLVGIFTTLADYAVHPSHFGGEYAESVLTGLGAAFLAFVWEKATTKPNM